MITDPRFAPKRTDLPWLRRRRAQKSGTPVAEAPPLRDFLSGRSHGEHHHEQPTEPAPPPSRAASTPARAASAPASSSLDLDEPSRAAPSPPSPPAASTSLDLDDAEHAAPTTAAVAAPSPAPAGRAYAPVRVRAGERLILTPADPTVTLTRLQSAIGTLTIEAAVSDEVGDLRLGCAYELASDLELTMQMTQGERFAPPHSKRPILLGGRERFERVLIDLRQCRDLSRLVVYAFSEARQPIKWGGTLVVTTFGGARVELPLESLREGSIGVLLSIYQVRGEFVLRAEMQTLYGDVREASRAYGYDRITWLDDRTPVT